MSKITPPPALADENKLIGLARQAGFHVGGQFVPGTDEATLTRLVQAINQQWLDLLAQKQDREQNFEEFGEGWESLAWELCAEEHGEEACSELIWEGGVVPEPWGDRWLKYEEEAKRLIALVHKHAAPVAQQSAPVPLTDEQRDAALNVLCRMFSNSEEVEGPDGMAMLVPLDLWHEAQEALDELIGEDGDERAHGIGKGEA